MHIDTPIFTQNINGKTFSLKMDAAQPTGSFKIRGMGCIANYFAKKGASQLVSSSGGNAGYSLAFAGRQLGIPVTVVVPVTTPKRVQDMISSLDATVIVHGEVWDEANLEAQKLARKTRGAYIHPFDHPKLWEGHASLIEECAEKMDPPDAVVVAVGGGGLLCGVLEGMHAHGWNKVPVYAAETSGAASFQAALAANQVVQIPTITSIAKSLGAKKVAQEAFLWSKRHKIHSLICSDAQALDACRKFANQHRVLVEPACGAALSAMYNTDQVLPDSVNHVLIVVCGGVGITLDDLFTP